MPATTPREDYDNPWKVVIFHNFRAFLEYYFPELHASIDWANPPVFLDKDLAPPYPDARIGTRIADLLVRVHCNGAPLLIHVEIQAQRDERFAERMLTYNYRIFDRYHTPVVSLAVLADADESWHPADYSYGLGQLGTSCHFGAVKLLDLEGTPGRHENLFHLATAAQIAALRTRRHPGLRLRAKLALIQQLYLHDWSNQRMMDAYLLIDWLLRLPPAMERQFVRQVETMEKESHMAYITSAERIGRADGLKQGLKQGLEQGLEQGLQQGRVTGQRELLARLLERRCGPLPGAVQQRLAAATSPDLERWSDALLDAHSLEDVQRAMQ